MEPFTAHTGRAVPLRRTNVDTDQIIPAEYLKRVSRAGFGEGLFAAWREDPSFVYPVERLYTERGTDVPDASDAGDASGDAVKAPCVYDWTDFTAPKIGSAYDVALADGGFAFWISSSTAP